MDFALPSSYDSIADAKSASVDELTQEENVLTGTKVKKAPKKDKSSSGDNSPLFQQLTPEEKEKAAAEQRAAREAKAAEKLAVAAEKEAEKAALAAEKQAQKEAMTAERAAEQAQKNAEKAEQQKAAAKEKAQKIAEAEAKSSARKEATKFAGADFVDMGLPSYDSSASAGGKKNSVFAL